MGDVLKFKDNKLTEIFRVQRSPNKEAPSIDFNTAELSINKKFLNFLLADIKYHIKKFERLEKTNEVIVCTFILEYLTGLNEELEHPYKPEKS